MNAGGPATPEAAATAVVDSLRHLLSTVGSVLASPAGLEAVKDAAQVRSLPALGKSLKRLWFHTPTEEWDSKEQAVWLSRVLAVTEGSREGILSFYGAGLLFCDALAVFAEVSLAELDLTLDEAWVAGALAVQEVLQGRHWEQLQQWPADRRCGGGSDPFLSVDRLPRSLKQTMDLEGVRLTKAQAAGLGVVMLLPGSMTLAMGGLGCALLAKTARERSSSLGYGSAGSPESSDRWQVLQEQWLKHAHSLLRRKSCPIEVRYSGTEGPNTIKVCLYSFSDPLCALPVGSLRSSATGGDSEARLPKGGQCRLRPVTDADRFRLRVYKPAPFFDQVLNDGVEVRRGDRVAVIVNSNSQAQVYAERCRAAGTGEATDLDGVYENSTH